MIRINQIKIGISHTEIELRNKIKKTLKLNNDNFTYRIIKKSIDARKKPELFFVYSIAVDGINDNKVLAKAKNSNISFIPSLSDNSSDIKLGNSLTV